MLDGLSPTRRRFVLLVVLAALLTAVVTTALVVVRTVGSDPAAQDLPGPVLLVSGYGGDTASLDPLRDALRAAGRDVVVVRPVGGGTGDLGGQADAL
ncbi:MAG: lipase, partial [Nocardioidaceae bacterium]|nr:lipase [Nocardioidaceae bacterium]